MPQDYSNLFNIGQSPIATPIDPRKLALLQGQSGAAPWSLDMSGSQADGSPLPETTPDTPPVAMAPAKQPSKGLQTKNTRIGEADKSKSGMRYTPNTPEGVRDQVSMMESIPSVKDQYDGILNMSNQYAQMATRNNPDDSWVKPLLALSDAVNGTNQAASFQSGTERRTAALQKFSDEIQKRRNDYNNMILNSFQRTRAGTDTTKEGEKNVTNNYIGAGVGSPGAQGIETPDKAWARVQGLIETARGQPGVAQAEKDRYASTKMNSLMSLYPDPNNMPAAQVQMLASEAAKIAQGGAPTMHELQGLDPGTLQSIFSRALSKVDNKVTPANAGEFLRALTDYGNSVSKDAEDVIEDKYGRVLRSNQQALGPHWADAEREYLKRFSNPNNPTVSSASTTPTPAAKPKSVTQGGHTYILNEKTGEYE